MCAKESECIETSISCAEESSLCTLNKGCSNECINFPPNKVQYYILTRFLVTIKDQTGNHFYLESGESGSKKIRPGDLIAIQSRGTQIAHRLAAKHEFPDFKTEGLKLKEELSKDSKLLFASDKFREIKGVKHLIRIILSEPLVLTIPHRYTETHSFLSKITISDEWNEMFDIESIVKIESAVTKLKLSTNTEFAIVGTNVNFSVNIYKGSSLKLMLDFGDGNVIRDEIAKGINITTNLDFYNIFA